MREGQIDRQKDGMRERESKGGGGGWTASQKVGKINKAMMPNSKQALNRYRNDTGQ